MKHILFIFLLLITLGSCCRKDTSLGTSLDSTFFDTIAINFDTVLFSEDYNTIYCNADIGDIHMASVLVDNAFYYSAITPDLLPLLESYFTIIDTIPCPQGCNPKHWVGFFCKSDKLYLNCGNVSHKLDTVYINSWPQIAIGNNKIKAVIGRDFFEDHIVEINFRDRLMIVGNYLPEKANQYLSFPIINNNASRERPRQRCIKVDGFKSKGGHPITSIAMLDLGAHTTLFDTIFLKHVDQHFSQIDTSSLAWLILKQIGSAVDSVDFNEGKMDDNHNIVAKYPGGYANLSALHSDILLGTDFFRHFNVIFDYKNNMLYLKRNEQ